MIRREITKLIEKSIKTVQKKGVFPKFDISDIRIEHPEEKTHGDYAANIAMQIVRTVKKNPMEIAKIISSQLFIVNKKTRLFERIEVVKPGFINFFLSKKYLQKQVEDIIKERSDVLRIGKNKTVNIEFISANPTGLLHLGNGRGAFFGDSLANVLEKAGYKVTREYLINNAKVNTQIRLLGKTALGRGKTYLNEYLISQVRKLQPKFKNKSEGEAGYLIAQEIQKDIKNFIERKLKIKFDSWISEERFYKEGRIKKVYNWLKKKKLIYRKEGAEWLRISKFGAPKDEVIIRQTGEPTYFLSDIAYHKDKFSRNFQKIIDIWGADHQGHVPKIEAISKILGYKGQLDILISQMMRLKRGKISKRKGKIITLESLIDEVGLDTVKFFYLMKSFDTQMEFDVELAKKRSAKSPVYYVQYAHARICAILRKCGKSEILISKFETNSKATLRGVSHHIRSNKIPNSKLKLLTHPSELELIKGLIRLPEIIEDTAKDYQIQRIPQYAIDLAASFHQFYRDCRVLPAPHRTEGSGMGTEDRLLSEARMGLVLATKTVMKNTLSLMGISAPERM